ncbi:LSU ribosomal protein L17P [Mycoplasma testudineum]|uniref:Large ribosomal subunit protein bL17 n=1 Tax=Mycoplasma testudineum TaxID=244584 RepID=A0A4R6IHS4_9MOLU|nr:50S ribosomal protein L17 [Mycoplasma testudineum]OYD27167.1 50S ribosomal protein L17 [Mycoplasma testudineum]TDO21075.1 LSU ribosomal protein L17P [Mycoplasma testudineum]
MANPTQLYRRNTKWRTGVMRSLATDVIVHGKIQTNLARAKQLRKIVDKLITLAKKNTLASRRQAAAVLRRVKTKNDVEALKYLFDTIGPKYKDRNGGYTRIIKMASRQGDNTKMAIIALV